MKTQKDTAMLNHPIPEKVDPMLVEILGTERRHGSQSELLFRAWLDKQLKGRTVQLLSHGVRFVQVGVSRTLFSCHIDTVDMVKYAPPVPGTAPQKTRKQPRKALVYDSNFGYISLDKANTVGSCLGADDGVGVWLMLQMIDAGVSGGYIFHTEEEGGGKGAKAVVQNHEAMFKGKFDHMIALDRPRDNEVITHQGSTRTCSDVFGLALAAALNEHGMEYNISPDGVYTDSKDYRGIIPECTNIGVGYQNQHGAEEFLDYGHAEALLHALMKVDWAKLPVARKAEIEKFDTPSYSRSYPTQGSWWADDKDAWDTPSRAAPKLAGVKATPPTRALAPKESVYDELMGTSTYDDLLATAESEPEVAAEIIIELMGDVAALRGRVSVLSKMLGLTE